MGASYLNSGIRYQLVTHAAHEGQIGPSAGDGEHYCGLVIEHKTDDPDYDGRPGHVSWKEAGWCPGYVNWCDSDRDDQWQLISFEPLTLQPSIQCSVHPDEMHIFITNGMVSGDGRT